MQIGSIAHVIQLVRELRLAQRRLVAAPAFALFSIVTLALAIGITTAVYTLVYHLMGQNYGVPDHAEVAGFHRRTGTATADALVSIADFRDIQDQQSSFATIAGWAPVRTSLGMETSVLAYGEMVTGDYFRTLRIAARRGRIFTDADDRAGAPPVAMVGGWAADRWLGGQEDVVGRVVRIGGQPFTVVGVVDDGFRGMAGYGGPLTTTFWVPVSAATTLTAALGPTGGEMASRSRALLSVVARLDNAQSMAGAATEVSAIADRLDAAYPLPRGNGSAAAARRDWSVGQAMTDRGTSASTAAAIIIGLPLLVFLIACTNLANLALSRSIARRNTLAVRHALGATRARLVREEMGETAIIAIVGGVAGLGVARWLLTVTMDFIQAGTTIPVSQMLPEFTLPPAILGTTFGITTLALVVGGLLPSLSLTRGNLREAMASGSDTALPRWRGRGNLIALQVGVSVGLFLVAISAARSFPDYRALWPGPGLEGLAVASIPFEQQQYDEARVIDTLERVTADARRVPGVEAVAVIAGLSARDAALTTNRFTAVTTPDRPFSGTDRGIATTALAGTPGMFDVLALRPISGRVFGAEATRGTEPVAVVNEALALEVFGTTAATGRVLIVRTSTFRRPGADVATRVIGVVPNRRVDHAGHDVAELYLPFAQRFDPNVALLARGGDGVPPVTALRDAVRRVDPALATTFIGDGALVGATEATMLRGAVTIMNSLAAFALLLAMAGLYGVLSHVVSLRSRELAVRVALGASARRIASMVLRDGLRPVGEGLALALLVAVIIRQGLRVTVIDDLSAIDPLAFGIVTLLAGGCGLLACLLPSRRAARVDPNAVLKDN